ncbi:sugar ABC transporter permease [Nakamurella flavida]|uniref:Sugar ABC transporter permease n=1 Tax=Nakamurella flavida TaxID=363630 RepID=A0A938YRG2_9ACTN|nr:sugar ABC transporter permease [Nakamurella flavida]MBM9477550.1 sugar ABC transporter permease [Nakamurella flavida]MDP9779098.1 alpha-glucoside transport system permease protein [Nakamurella flavida]
MDFLLNPTSVGDKLISMVLAVVIFGVIMAVLLFAIDRPKVPNWVIVAAFLGPVAILLAVGLFYPAAGTVVRSFQVSVNAVGPDGGPVINPNTGQRLTELGFSFDNYTRVFTDPAFQKTLLNTVWWVVLVPVVSTLFGLIYAVLVDRTRFEKAAKALVFLPMAISMVGASIIWKFVYEYRQGGSPQIGLANQVLVWLGADPYQFIITQPWNTFFLIVVMIWINAGFAMTILSAAIKAVPDDIVEAAQIDGATGFKLFRRVTVPTIRPAVVVVLTTIAMGSLKAFDVVRTMTGGNYGTSIVANEFYTQSFRQGEGGKGIGAALAVVLFVIIIPVIVYNVRQMRLAEEVR